MINDKHKFFELSQSVKGISAPLMEYLGVSYFAFKRTFVDGSKIYLFNNPYYYEHYFSKNYFLVGNREAGIENYVSSYDLWDYLPDPKGLYKEASDCFNIDHGLTVTKKHDEFCDFFFFATNRDNPLIKRLYVNKQEIFQNFCEYFLEQGKELISTASQSKVILPRPSSVMLKGKDFNINGFMQEISSHKNNWTTLTKRELSCAYFLLQGKSNKEIAQKLNISPRTVEDYVSNIRFKIKCKNRSELISILCKWPMGVFQIF